MLRFERKSRNRDVSISLRANRRGLNSPFLAALGAAIAIHALGFFIFQVVPFKFPEVDTVLPPVAVRADTGAKTTGIIYVPEEQIERPTFTEPKLPKIPENLND